MSASVVPLSTLIAPDRHIFLSPHYDDIPLSCGGTVSTLAAAGRQVDVVVIFGAPPSPDQQLSEFAQELHRRWGVSVSDVITRRRAEEETAAAILGARVRVLEFPDAIYRGNWYVSEETLMGEPAPDERQLPQRIAARIADQVAPAESVRFYAPLGIGGHVDHRLVFGAGVHLARGGADVWFYEDLPYGVRPGALERRLAMGAEPVSVAGVVPVADAWERKIDAIMAYRSQLAAVFHQIAEGTERRAISEVLRGYATAVGDGVPGERFWRLSDEELAPNEDPKMPVQGY